MWGATLSFILCGRGEMGGVIGLGCLKGTALWSDAVHEAEQPAPYNSWTACNLYLVPFMLLAPLLPPFFW